METSWDSTQGVVCLQNVLVCGVSVICSVLATECLTMDVAHDLLLVCSFPCVMSMSSFVLFPLFWGQRYFKQLEIKRRRISSTHWNFLPILSYMFLHFIYFHEHLHILYYISKFPHLYPEERYFCQGWSVTYLPRCF